METAENQPKQNSSFDKETHWLVSDFAVPDDYTALRTISINSWT